ncbi:MAG: phage protease [Candidatus Anammoxibacter sp.]
MKYSLSEIINLSDHQDGIKKVQLLRIGSFEDYGDTLEITSDMLRQMKKNFDDDIKRTKIAVDFSHRSGDEAAGWIQSVGLEDNDSKLFIVVEWTEAAEKKILGKEFRYLSADFNLNFRDNETGKSFGAVLNGGALTNRPRLKGMDAILHDLDVSDKKRQAIKRILDDEPETKEETMKFDEIMKAAKDANLSEDESNELAKSMGVKLAEDKPEPKKEDKPKEDVQLSDAEKENIQLKEKMETMEKEAAFDVLLSDGKACPAQKDAYLSGDMAKFASLHKDINLSAAGKGDGGKENSDGKKEAKTHAEAEDKILELSAEKMKDNDTLTLSEANSAVINENPDLAKLCNAA